MARFWYAVAVGECVLAMLRARAESDQAISVRLLLSAAATDYRPEQNHFTTLSQVVDL
jgi:hypothetical protein